MRAHVAALHGDVLEQYPRCLYNSFHTTAGFLDQSLAWRLSQRRQGLTGYMDAFRAVFPPGAGYRHDELELRRDLSAAQRKIEPKNADSHLAFMAAGLRTCVIYVNRRNEAVPFVDLDGVNDGRPRLRQAGIVDTRRRKRSAAPDRSAGLRPPHRLDQSPCPGARARALVEYEPEPEAALRLPRARLRRDLDLARAARVDRVRGTCARMTAMRTRRRTRTTSSTT